MKMLNILHSLFCLPLLVLYFFSSDKKTIRGDVTRWSEVAFKTTEGFTAFKLIFFLRKKVFRSILYHRLKCEGSFQNALQLLFSFIYKNEQTLVIYTRDIGPGFMVQHGLSTIVAAEKIGVNFWVNQQVTIGYANDNDCPTIGDNVTISAGAIVVGKLKIGDNVKVGVNAVVIGNIPDNSVVFSEPSRYFPSLQK